MCCGLLDTLGWSSGCRFRTRCQVAQERCADEGPELRQVHDHHLVACHFAESLS
ncbi:MAG TPA: hypothetical protein PK819_03160 [Thermomicrobiales bacterium]|nr:hypothetical protein [Thermomicrobiales bacterium]